MPISIKNFNIFPEISCTIKITRVANIVFIASDSLVFSSMFAHTRSKIGGIVFPSGYRPISSNNNGLILSIAQDPTGSDPKLNYDVKSNGDVYVSNSATSTNSRAQLFGAWITNDPWPTN